MSKHGNEQSARGQMPSDLRPPGWTKECPSIIMVDPCVRSGWPPEYSEHVSECTYCQRMIGLDYRIECPGNVALAQYKALGMNSGAFEFHLHQDACPKCAEALNSPTVQLLAGILGSKQGLSAIAEAGWQAPAMVVEWLRSVPNRARVLLVPSPQLSGALAGRHTLGGDEAPQTAVADGESSARIYMDQKDFQLSVNSADRNAGFVITPTGQGRSFQMEKRGGLWRAGFSLQRDLATDPAGSYVLVVLTPES